MFHLSTWESLKIRSRVSWHQMSLLIQSTPQRGTPNFKWRGWLNAEKKIPRPSSHTPKNPRKKNYPMPKFPALLIACVCGWNTRALIGFFRLLWIPEKIPPQIKPPKKYLPNFPTPKNPGIGNFKPQKILRFIPVTWNPEYSTWGQLSHCRHLAITVIPLIRTAAESQTEINSSYNGLEIAIEDTKSWSLECPL